MTELNRRHLISGAIAASAAGALVPLTTTVPARAAAPAAGKQAPGFYRYNVGDIQVTVVTDGARSFPLADGFVINATNEQINAALQAAYMPPDTVTTYFTPIVVNTGGKLALIDTGYGPGAAAQANSTAGLCQANLMAAGIDPKSIDTVIISHYHSDHIDGLLDGEGKPSFPNAEIKVPAVEHQFWMDDAEMSRAPKGRMEGLFKNNRRVFSGDILKRVSTYEWGKEVLPGITAVGTPGHTPGHTSYVVASGSSKVFVQSDVTNNPALFVRNPGWRASFDQDGQMAEETRRKVYDMLVADKLMVQGFHYPFPSLGHAEKDGSGYRITPIHWTPKV